MKIGDKVYAVVLDTGVVQSITPILTTAIKASSVDMAMRRYMRGTNRIEEVVVVPCTGKRLIDWVVESVEKGCTNYESCPTRSEAREYKKWLKESLRIPSKIIRREYVLVNEKEVR